jgi:alkylation response protein AidB-like acyl-CoA dehydrogenase
MLAAANHAWTMYPGLLHGAYECLHAHASPALKAAYLGKVVSGEWLSTMCLTEAQAGSDLGLLKTRAEPQGDGSFQLRGHKIFISGGEHDLTDNIVHLVLARLPDAPAGTKGISLFLCPKFMPDGARNALHCDGIEKKMGIKGSATCVMRLDGATGWLIGEPNRGLAAMFAMMNAARLHVALQGLGHAENAHQNALRYAQERLQSRAAVRPAGVAAAPADPIAMHPAMRRTLLRQRVLVEGSRLVAYEAAHWLDVSEQSADAAQRTTAHAHVSLLTPVLKAFFTANGFEIASDALQVFGGHGYVFETGIEQCVRDSRIAMIYEGTNEIQAIDLLLRKVLPDGAARFCALLDQLDAGLPAAGLHTPAARAAIVRLRDATLAVVPAAAADPELAYRVADDFLRATGFMLIMQAWARAEAVSAHAALSEDPFHLGKRASARHCFTYMLPELEHALQLMAAGRAPLAHVLAPA